MEAQTKKNLLIGGAAVVAVLFLLSRSNKSGDEITMGDAFNNPVQNGSPYGFRSEITVKADPNLLAGLDQKYMPLFGFVGMTTTGQMPVAIAINQQFINQQTPGAGVVVGQAQRISYQPIVSDFQRRVNDARSSNLNWRSGF